MGRLRMNPLDDPAVRTWDTFVTGSNRGPDDIDHQLFDMLGRLQEASDALAPDAAFLEHLEAQLFGSDRAGKAITATLQADPDSIFSSSNRSLPGPRRMRLITGKVLDQLSIAALLAVILAGLAVMFIASRSEPEQAGPIPAIPDSREELEQALNPPTLETLLDFTIDPTLFAAPLPTTWETLEFSLTTVEPGVEFSSEHPYFSCCPSLIVLHVMGGSAEFSAEGLASIYRKGASSSESASADVVYPLASGDSVVFSTSSQTVMRNTGQDDLRLLNGRAIDYADSRYMGLVPEGYIQSPYLKGRTLDPLQSEVINFRFERVLLDPGDFFTVESLPTERLLGWYPERPTSQARFVVGDESAISAGEMGEFLGSQYTIHDFPEGEYTILNTGDEPITLHFLHLVEAPVQPENTDRTSESLESIDELRGALSPPVTEPLLGITVDPADLGAITADNWDRLDFVQVHVEPNDQFTTDHPFFSCCPGMGVFHVWQGSVSLVVDGPIDFYEAGSATREPIPPETVVALETGDTAVFALENPAIFTNTGAEKLLMFGGYAFQFNSIPGIFSVPEGYLEHPLTKPVGVDFGPVTTLKVSIESVVLDPGEVTHVEVTADVKLSGFYTETNASVRLLFGTYDALSAEESDSFAIQTFGMSNFAEGPYTFFNDGNNPATLYFLRLAEG